MANGTLTCRIVCDDGCDSARLHWTRREWLATSGGILASHALSIRGTLLQSQYQPASRLQGLLQVPQVLRPSQTDTTTDMYDIVQRESVAELLPGKKTNELCSIAGLYSSRRG